MRSIFALCLVAFPAFADECPPVPDQSAALEDLVDAARAAKTESEGRVVGGQMWAIWADAPDEVSQGILDQGMRRRESYDFAGALEDFNRLVTYCPHYAEGYNQRAFVNYIRQDFSAALPDLERALELSPNHVAAQAGKALTLMQLGRLEEARKALLVALDLNPWLSERHLLAPGAALAPKGKDI